MTYAQPAPATPALEVSTWGRRFGAWLIDSLIFGIPFFLILFGRIGAEMEAAGAIDPITGEASQTAVETVMNDMFGFITGITMAYYVLFAVYLILMHGTVGSTLGKMATGIKVVRTDGSKCDMATAAKRALVFPIAALVPFVGGLIALLNGLWPLWDSQKQSLGDKVGGSFVVRK
jgi:uncharacterized RDD family membrane protein YckC